MATRTTDRRVLVYRKVDADTWVPWKEAKLIGETDEVFQVKGWLLMQWLAKSHFKYEIITPRI